MLMRMKRLQAMMTVGVLMAGVYPSINFNSVWFNILGQILNLIVTLLLGGSTSGNNTGL